MTWFLVAILAYFLLAIVALIDKYLLGKALLSPQMYAFYVGILGILALILIPFGFLIPQFLVIILALLAGFFHILGIFVTFKAIQIFEVSRVVPAIGGLLPLFVFGLTFILPVEKEPLSLFNIIAFFFLVLGSIIIAWEKSKNISLESFKMATLAAFLFALYFVFAKFVYLSQPFISGFVWTRIGAFLAGITFLFAREVREEIFEKRKTLKVRTWAILIPNQIMAAGAFLLQNWAVFLAPLTFLAFINGLEGTRYIFLLIFTIILSLKFPKILKEEISKKVIFQKIVAILLIGAGLTFLSIIQ